MMRQRMMRQPTMRQRARRLRGRLSRLSWPVLLCLVVIASAAVTIFVLRANHMRDGADGRPASVASIVAAAAAGWQAKLPQRFGAITDLTTVKADGRTLNFFYRIGEPEVFGRMDFAALADEAAVAVCTSASDVALLRRGASYHYWFSDGALPHRRKYTIKYADCAGALTGAPRRGN